MKTTAADILTIEDPLDYCRIVEQALNMPCPVIVKAMAVL